MRHSPVSGWRAASAGGFTLVEVLVTIAIFAIGLLGVASLQVASLRMNRAALYDSQATLLAQEMLERMQINWQEARAGNYDIAYDETAPTDPECLGAGASCDPAQMRRHDLAEWRDLLASAMPGGQGEIAVDDTVDPPVATVRVRWRDADADNARDVELAVRLPADG